MDVVGHRRLQRGSHGLLTGDLDVDPVDVEGVLDGLKILGQFGVVGTDDRNAGDGVLLVGSAERRENRSLGRPEIAAVDPRDAVRVLGHQRVEVRDDRGVELRVVDRRALGSGVENDHVALGVAAERLVGESAGGSRLRRRIVETTLAQVVREIPAVRRQDRQPGHHDTENGVSEAVDEISPSNEHVCVAPPGCTRLPPPRE